MLERGDGKLSSTLGTYEQREIFFDTTAKAGMVYNLYRVEENKDFECNVYPQKKLVRRQKSVDLIRVSS